MAKKRKRARRSRSKAAVAVKKAAAANRKALWEAYRSLQKKADKAWDKFRKDVKRNAKSAVLLKDQRHLRLLLGECNYMARECQNCAKRLKKRW